MGVGLAWWRNECAATDELRDHIVPCSIRCLPKRTKSSHDSRLGSAVSLVTKRCSAPELPSRSTRPSIGAVRFTQTSSTSSTCFPERIVVRLEFSESDADLDLFFELTNLENLYISEPDERILSRLGQFKKLRFLVPGLRPSFMGTYVWTNPITDRWIAYLANLTQIECWHSKMESSRTVALRSFAI